MSIYPVKLIDFFPPSKKKEDKFLHETALMLVKIMPCIRCGKIGKYKNAWGHHSILWGHGDIWCSKRCLNRIK